LSDALAIKMFRNNEMLNRHWDIFIFPTTYTVMKFKENGEGLEMKGTHQLLVCADDVNLVSENINIVKLNTEHLLDASKETGVGVKAEKPACMFMSRHQTTGQNRCVNVANKSFENVSKFIYFGMTLTNQN
jgi:hypothetical protein